MPGLHTVTYLLLLQVIFILTDAAVAARNGHGLSVRAAEARRSVLRLALLEDGNAISDHLQKSEKESQQNESRVDLVNEQKMMSAAYVEPQRIIFTYGACLSEHVTRVLCRHMTESYGSLLQRIELFTAVLVISLVSAGVASRHLLCWLHVPIVFKCKGAR